MLSSPIDPFAGKKLPDDNSIVLTLITCEFTQLIEAQTLIFHANKILRK
jgi:hypothetical protein